MNNAKTQGVIRHVLGIVSGMLAGSFVAPYLTVDVLEALAGLIGAVTAVVLSVNAPEKKDPAP